MLKLHLTDNYAKNSNIGDDMPNERKTAKSIVNKFLELTGYVILIALLVFMLLIQWFPNLGLVVGDQVIKIGLLAGFLTFLSYFDSRISRIEEVRCEVIERSGEILDKLAELKLGVVRSDNIWPLFEAAMPVSNHVKELRIFALNTDKIFDAFHSNAKRFHADKLFLLLQSSEKSKDNLKSWKRLIPKRIREFDCVLYDPTPSSYFVIFNRECMILGGYYPDDNPSGAYYIAPFLIRDGQIIDSYIRLHEKTMDFHRATKADG